MPGAKLAHQRSLGGPLRWLSRILGSGSARPETMVGIGRERGEVVEVCVEVNGI